MRTYLVGVLLTAGGCLSLGCHREATHWEMAKTRGDIPAFEEFLQHHPGSPYAKQAEASLKALRDEKAWATTSRESPASLIESYLSTHADGRHADEARLYLAALKSPRAETLKAYLAAFPEGRFAESLTTQLRDVQTMATRDQCVEVYRRDVVDLFRRLRSMLPQGALFADGSYSVGPMVVGPGGTRPPEPRKLDPWGNEFTLEVRRGRGHVRSPGPDSKKWTDDDVRCPTEDVVLH